MQLVSVIIPTRNRADLLREAIQSVLAVEQSGFELETIVIDDGSTDNTAQVVQALPVRYLRTEGIGVSSARNLGIEAANGEFLAFLDDDDLWLPQNVQTQLDVLQKHPEYGAVMAQFQLTDENRTPYDVPYPTPPLPSGWLFEFFMYAHAQLGTIVVRRSVAETIGGMDPRISQGEDWEWMLRIARRYQIGLVEKPVMLFRVRTYGAAGYDEEEAEWKKLRVVLKTLGPYAQEGGLGSRLRMQRSIWKRRGWYASVFVQKAEFYLSHQKRDRALRCLYLGLRASPIHFPVAFGKMLRFHWTKGKQPS